MKYKNQFWCLEYDIAQNIEWFPEQTLYYDLTKKKWVYYKDYHGNFYPASFPCKSLRAAKKHLKNHNEIPKGTCFRLVSSLVGGDRYLTKH